MTTSYAIQLSQVTKEFRRFQVAGGHTTLKTQLVGSILGRRREALTHHRFQALRGIDLAVLRGTSVGCIGANGSGKSTLLKIAAGIYQPTSGAVTVRGKVSALIDLGAGFHPDFTGRENVVINGLILGLSRKEIDQRFDSIVDFAEIAEFIDAPVRTYSSGMVLRLGFSVAVHVDAEVLLIDEILSVGDEHFSRKCEQRMVEHRQSGRSILLVTHSLGALEKWCDEAVWLDAGRIVARGVPKEVAAEYSDAVRAAELTLSTAERFVVRAVALSDAGGAPTSIYARGGACRVNADVTLSPPCEVAAMFASVKTSGGLLLFDTTHPVPPGNGAATDFRVVLRIDSLDLESGDYILEFGTITPAGERKVRAQRAFIIADQRTLPTTELRHGWECTPK